MSASYKVIAPFVTLKVKDANGQTVVQGYYADGVVQNPIEGESLDKHLRTGLIEPVEDVEPEPEPTPAQVEKPAGNASQEVWAAYAVTQGASADEVKDLKQTELRELYG